MEEKRLLGNSAIALLILCAITVEFTLSYMMIWLSLIPAITHGYWLIAWIFIPLWGIISVVWLGLMWSLISKKKRTKLIRRVRREVKNKW